MTQGLKKIACSVAAATVLAALGGCTGGGGGQPTDQPTDPADTQSSTDGTTPAADPCADGRRTLVAAVQRYVDGYGTPADSSGTPSASPGPSTGDTDLRNAIAQSRAEIERKSCDEQAYERALSGDLDGVRTRGPLAAAVLLRLGASLTGTARTVKETRDVGPGDDLPHVLAEVAPGSTLRLAPGTFRLARSLVLLQGVTLLGSGPGRTTVSSGAAGAVAARADRGPGRALGTLRPAHGATSRVRGRGRPDVVPGADRFPGVGRGGVAPRRRWRCRGADVCPKRRPHRHEAPRSR